MKTTIQELIKWHYLSLFILHFTFYIPKFANGQVLETYIEAGLQHSLALKQENLEIDKAIEAVNQAKALFYPRVTFAPTYSLAAGGRKLDFPIGDLLNPVYSTLNQLTRTQNFPQVENVSQLLAPNNFHDTKLSVQYAIYDPQIKYNYLIQKQLVSVQEAKRKVLENEIRYNVSFAYYQYLQTLEVLKVYDNARQTLNELLRLNRKLVDNQVLTKEVIPAAEYEISKLNQQTVVMTKNRELAKAYLAYLSPLQAPSVDNRELKMALDKAMAIKQIPPLGEQAGLMQLDRSIEVSKQLVEMNEKAATKPTVFAGLNGGFQGFGYKFSGQQYAILQLGLNWELFKGYEKKSKIQQAKIQTEILKTKRLDIEQQLELQATQAFLELQAAQESLKLTEDAQTKAEAYFKIVDSKYKNGNLLFIEWLKAQNEVTAAQLQQSVAQFDVLLKYAFLTKVANQ